MGSFYVSSASFSILYQWIWFDLDLPGPPGDLPGDHSYPIKVILEQGSQPMMSGYNPWVLMPTCFLKLHTVTCAERKEISIYWHGEIWHYMMMLSILKSKTIAIFFLLRHKYSQLQPRLSHFFAIQWWKPVKFSCCLYFGCSIFDKLLQILSSKKLQSFWFNIVIMMNVNIFFELQKKCQKYTCIYQVLG